jgi:lycopene cyclase domain-containing protein
VGNANLRAARHPFFLTGTSGDVDPNVADLLVLPDIGAVFGSYTYLASEIAFGSVAFLLLYRAGALRRAGRTILALYPIAYVWDWYTLQYVDVFDINLRIGVDLLGIPIEEHVFMIVVPALVIGFHETLVARFEDQPDP